MTDRQVLTMLGALCTATFFVTSTGVSTAPFMNQLTRDLSSSLPAIAHLFSIQALAWGTASFVAGMLSDRIGRRAILVAGVVLIGLTRVGFAAADTYAGAVLWHIAGGLGGGAFMGVVYAAVSEHVEPGIRGRAMSWVITGQSLSLVLGVPLVTLLGAFGGWRGAIAVHGGFLLLCAIAVRLATPPDPSRHHAEHRKIPYRAILKPRFISLLAAGTTERVCFGVIALFLPIYLQRAYEVSLSSLAVVLGVVALGNLAGNIVGGRIADRTRSRARVFAIGSALTAVLALPLLGWHPHLWVSVFLGFAFSFVNAAGRPSLLAILASVPSEVRGAILGLNITMASMGWLLAGSIGGWLISTSGFVGLGAFAAGVAAIGTALGIFSANKRAK